MAIIHSLHVFHSELTTSSPSAHRSHPVKPAATTSRAFLATRTPQPPLQIRKLHVARGRDQNHLWNRISNSGNSPQRLTIHSQQKKGSNLNSHLQIQSGCPLCWANSLGGSVRCHCMRQCIHWNLERLCSQYHFSKCRTPHTTLSERSVCTLGVVFNSRLKNQVFDRSAAINTLTSKFPTTTS